ncbi:MAG TPA: hypothetical protein VH540_28825 [Ktedonobacterales bacterium]|jgi:hypothetical protein
MQEEPSELEVQVSEVIEARPEEMPTSGLLARQLLLGWGQPPQMAILQGAYLFILPGLLALYFWMQFAEVAGLTGGRVDVTSAVLTGVLLLIHVGFVVLPALVVLVLGLLDLRARPRLVGGRVLAVRHIPGRSSQRHYIQLETPGGRRERFRVHPAWHNQCCHPGAQVALSVSPRLHYVSKVWTEAAEPPILV